MKAPAFLRTGLFLLAGLAAITAFAADEFNHSYIAQINVVQDGGGAKLFAAGDSALTVLNKLDQPHYRLSKSVWLYRNFPAPPHEDAGKHFCDNLIISFEPGKTIGIQKVTAIVLANAKGLERIEKGLKQNPRYLEDLLTGY
jgi:hypothetical protein